MLAPGTTLGPYRVLEKIGEGGMGVVYKAHDTRLERTVALKLLTKTAEDAGPSLRARLEHEARAISQLNHPHICTLYDIADATLAGSPAPVSYLVMEFVDGETLADRLARGRLPLERALQYGTQIADALDKAHRAGVIHGDLKPGNVMIAKAGVKLLDFGIARRRQPRMPAGWAEAATRTAQVGSPDGVVGTLQYLAPEVIEGRSPDERSDIFACGAVLYEMVTGAQAFPGDTAAAVIAAVMGGAPVPPSTLVKRPDPALDHVVAACLAKDPETRWQHAGDLAGVVRWLSEGGSLTPSRSVSASPGRWKVTAAILLATTLLLAAAVLWLPDARGSAPGYRTSVLLPDGLRFPTGGTVGGGGRLALSPDGQMLAVVGIDPAGRQMLWTRPLDGQIASPLAGTEGASSPFWSPDSRTVAFVAQGQLKTVAATGGAPALVASPAFGATGAWNAQGEILFTPTASSPLAVVSAAGGTPRPATRLDEAAGEQVHRNASFLPDGRHFLYVSIARNGAAVSSRRVSIGSLDGDGSAVTVLDDAAGAEYSSGHLLFLRDTTLFAQPFDPGRLALSGDARVVAEQVEPGGIAAASFTVSEAGVLAYQPSPQAGSQLVWFDRQGRQLGVVGDAADYSDVELSPDGRVAAVSVLDPSTNTRDLWTVDLERGVRTRLTSDKADDVAPVWSRDGSRVMFTSNRTGHFDLYERAASGIGPETLVYADMSDKYPTSWLSDARQVLYWTFNAEGTEVHVLSLAPEPRSRVFLPSPVSPGRFAPDGRHVLYYSVESGRSEVYLVPFPSPTRKWQVSSAGGNFARWRQDGKEVYYIGRDNQLVATSVDTSADRLEIGRPTPLFEARPVGVRYPFDVAPGGERFLVNTVRGASAVTSVTLVQNWSRPPAP